MLEFSGPAAAEGSGIAVNAEAHGVPESSRRLHAELALEGSECGLRRRWEPHLRASGAEEAVLRHHARDGDHGQTAVVDLSVEGPFAGNWVADCAGTAGNEEPGDAKLAAAWGISRDAVRLLPQGEELKEGNEHADLAPALRRHLRQRRHSVRQVRELDPGRWRQVARPTEVLGCNITHAGKHGNSAVFGLCDAPAAECGLIVILAQAQRVEELHGQSDPKLIVKSPARRCGASSCLGLLSRAPALPYDRCSADGSCQQAVALGCREHSLSSGPACLVRSPAKRGAASLCGGLRDRAGGPRGRKG
mmetsp:Transcript_111369/g.270576  ORF Transcript_111369/g.270576 Transcript_111369/m.270576 type:complete len:305 (+) Transcript_111369:574-1488(+)